MVKFVCDDRKVEIALRRLCSLVIGNGGMIDEGLTILCQGGHLSIEGPERMPEGKRIIFIPEGCLVPVQKGRLLLDGNRILVNTDAKSLKSVRMELLATMVQLFNLTGKIARQRRETVVGLFYREPELAKAILNCRTYEDLHLYKRAQRLAFDEFILEEFLASRELFLPGTTHAGRNSYLVPVVDCINHHSGAVGIIPAFEGERRTGVVVNNCRSRAKSAECHVLYGHYDAADSLVLHHFVDRHARFVRSVPLTVSIPNVAELEVGSRIEILLDRELPAALEDIRFYVPRIGCDERRRKAKVSFLLIPQGGAPLALRRVLAAAVGQLVRDRATADRAVLFAEQQVIRENVRHYRDLLACLDARRPAARMCEVAMNARLMAETQLANIAKYPFFDEAQRTASSMDGIVNAGDRGRRRSRIPPA